MSQSTCTVDGCNRLHEARGWCAAHYMRNRRHGDQVLRRTANGAGTGRYQKPNGYWVLKQPTHPLAAPSSGLVYEHRAVLMGAIGPGSHPCHWCGKSVDWRQAPLLEVDHLDGNREHNEASNLVPSCRSCNALRGNDTRWGVVEKLGRERLP